MNSSHPSDAYDASPFMSFSGSQKYQLSDWDSTHSFLLDNIPQLPFYFPPPPPPPAVVIPADYQRDGGLFKLVDGVTVTPGFGGGQGGDRIGLNLGHRTYFSYYDHQLQLFGRAAHHQPPRCQAEGCMADLSGAKHYHRRHKVCDFHSKAAVVFFPGGVRQRFCQQCSRFHRLDEFDETKRSCRKRLAEHNRRRRKPQPQPSMKNINASPSSLPPNTMLKEDIKLLISATKASKQLSSIMNSNATGENTAAKMAAVTGQYPGGEVLALGGRTGGPTFVSPEQLQSQCASQCSSSNAFFRRQNLLNEGSHSTGGGSEMTQHNQNNILQLGQAMFEWDFI